ncbi:hypothetical protein BH11PSE13_BH11PSE13_42820 [soil metagenome]
MTPTAATATRTAGVTRGFAAIAEGQVHYREAGASRSNGTGENPAAQADALPLVMLHASPGSARLLEPLIGALGRHRHVIATDTLGNGDSCAPALAADGGPPSIAYFADAHVRALDALGVAAFDLYGSHTGANIACEIAIAHPARVRRLILDGVSLYDADERADMLLHYAPGVKVDAMGSQLHWIWQFVRDTYLFWPWYKHDAAHARSVGLPSPDDLHDKVVEVLKAARTYHLSYRAAIGYDKSERLPLVKVPTLLACARTDMLHVYFDRVRALMPEAMPTTTAGTSTPHALADTADRFEAFLAAPPPR